MIGTMIILFVRKRKSAEASITSIAILSELNPQQMAQANKNETIPKAIPPQRRYDCLLS